MPGSTKRVTDADSGTNVPESASSAGTNDDAIVAGLVRAWAGLDDVDAELAMLRASEKSLVRQKQGLLGDRKKLVREVDELLLMLDPETGELIRVVHAILQGLDEPMSAEAMQQLLRKIYSRRHRARQRLNETDTSDSGEEGDESKGKQPEAAE